MSAKKLILLNICAFFAAIVLLLFLLFKGLDLYTRHGKTIAVPEVTGLQLPEARKMLERSHLKCVVSDSLYNKEMPAGSVLDCRPQVGKQVKEGRVVYLTVNTSNVPMYAVPEVADNSSMRQAIARIEASGFKLDSIERVQGEKDWVYGVKYKGRELYTGEKVPMGASLVLMVGEGIKAHEAVDSLTIDSVLSAPVKKQAPVQEKESKPQKKEEEKGEEESWF